MIGSSVGRYRIDSELGSGGMGVVYEAFDSELGRVVAIKFLPQDAAGGAEAVERFRREARAASTLNHPGICTVYDVGTHDGQRYMVMERLTGRTLRDEIGGRPMPVARLLALGEQIADALDAAHRAGIVHRDLKPANLWVTARGDAKVLDFGLAKLTEPGPGDGPVSADSPTISGSPRLTEIGSTLGTVAYMSPEQARGEALDARSDIFSLSVVLYEMATGRPPFTGGSPAELFASILRSDPAPPSASTPELPAGFDALLARGLAKDRTARIATAAELRDALSRLRAGESIRMPRRRSRRARLARQAVPRDAREGGSWQPARRS